MRRGTTRQCCGKGANAGFGTGELAADFDSILGRFSDALATVKVAANALDPENLGPETLVLTHGIDALNRTYNELDLAILRLPRRRRQK